MLEISNIDVFYGDLQVLWNVSLKVNKAEIVVIVGPNATGKTTLFNTISGFLHPKSGSINFLGNSRIDKLHPYRVTKLGISHIPQGRLLFSRLTVEENIELGAYLPEAREKKDETLEWVFQLFPILKERRKQRAGTLSGGEQQMLAIARGLMSAPKLLILDEPSIGLAPKLVASVFETVEKINEKGLAILVAEQNLAHALKIADRGYVLETGRIVLEGKGSEILKNKYVKKAYLGM